MLISRAIGAAFFTLALIGCSEAGWFPLGSPGAVGETVVQVITPDASWDGTAGSGGTAPAVDTDLQGSGFGQRPISGLSAYPWQWIENEGQTIFVGFPVHGDDAGVPNIRVWCEGNEITLTEAVFDEATGIIGYPFEVQSAAGEDGDANCSVYATPVNGYELKMDLPLVLNTNGSIDRDVRFIGPAGNDTTGDGLTAGTAWRSILKAAASTPDGGIVKCLAGDYVEDVEAGVTNSNTRPIEIRPNDGLVAGDCIIKRTARMLPSDRWLIRADKVVFGDMWVELDKIVYIRGGGATDGLTMFVGDSRLYDPNGADGPFDVYGVPVGYYATHVSGALFRSQEGQFNGIIDGTVENYVSGARLAVNATYIATADTGSFEDEIGYGGTRSFGLRVYQENGFYSRLHIEEETTVATATYSGGTNRTTITWSGSPALLTDPDGQGGQDVYFLTGPLAGQVFPFFSQVDATDTTIVTGDASAAGAGDLARGLLLFHPDLHQAISQNPGEETPKQHYHQRSLELGIDAQGFFNRAGSYAGSGTISTTGTALTSTLDHDLIPDDFVVLNSGAQDGEHARVIATPTDTTATLEHAFGADQSGATWRLSKSQTDFGCLLCVMETGAVNQSQFQDATRNFVMRQSAVLGSNFWMRNDSLGFALEDFILEDSLFESMSGDTGFPTTGFLADNNQFMSGTGRGTNSTVGAVVFNGNFQPVSGLSKTMTPYVPWDYDGNPISAGALIGPKIAGAADVIAPTLSGLSITPLASGRAARILVDTTGRSGAIYFVVTQSATPPTAQQIIDGEDENGDPADWAGEHAVFFAGTKRRHATWLTSATAYWSYEVHEDRAGNRSSVVAGTFTTL